MRPTLEPGDRVFIAPTKRGGANPSIGSVVVSRHPNRPEVRMIKRLQGMDGDGLVLLGDNVYADSADPEVIAGAWQALAAHPEFAALRQQTQLLATWDDHDYGQDDGGGEFPARAASQRCFQDFLGLAPDDPRRQRAGVYHAEIHGEPGRRVQFILLDTRFHRSPQLRWQESDQQRPAGMPGPYASQHASEVTILGAEQWQWLEEQLRQPAEVRLICATLQEVSVRVEVHRAVISEEHVVALRCKEIVVTLTTEEAIVAFFPVQRVIPTEGQASRPCGLQDVRVPCR